MTKLKISFIREHQDNPPGVRIRAFPEFVTETFIPNIDLRDVTTPENMQQLVTEGAKDQILGILFGDAKRALQQVKDQLDAAGQRFLAACVRNCLGTIAEMERNVEVRYGSAETLQSLADEVSALLQFNHRLLLSRVAHQDACRKALRKLSNRRSRGLKALCREIMGK